MAVDYLLEIDGIKGESRIQKHKNEIDVLSWSWGANNAGSYAQGGAGAGKVSVQDFHFRHRIDKSSPQLMLSCATGKHIPKAVLHVRKSGNGGSVDYIKITMSDVLVSSFSHGGSGEPLPTEQISLNYSKIEFDYVLRGRTTSSALVPDPIDPAGGTP